MKLIGLQDLILITPESIQAVTRADAHFQNTFTNELFKIYRLQDEVRLVDVLSLPPTLINSTNWQESFRNWYLNYTEPKSALVVNSTGSLSENSFSSETLLTNDKCHPSLQVDYNHIRLTSDCPGKWHLLKFTYHPAWQTTTNDPIYLVSPGFMLISPKQNEVELKFGPHWTWIFSAVVSILSLVIWMIFYIRKSFAKI